MFACIYVTQVSVRKAALVALSTLLELFPAEPSLCTAWVASALPLVRDVEASIQVGPATVTAADPGTDHALSRTQKCRACTPRPCSQVLFGCQLLNAHQTRPLLSHHLHGLARPAPTTLARSLILPESMSAHLTCLPAGLPV